MTKYAKHSAAFFLFIFTAYLIAGSALKGQSYYAANFGSDQSTWTTSCNNAAHLVHFNQAQDYFQTAEELPVGDKESAAIINCSTSLNILPVFNVFLFKPGQKESSLQYFPSFLVSQTYIYQEPDPPQFS